MAEDLLKKLGNKTITKEGLAQKITKDFKLLPGIINAMDSNKAAIRYGCGKVLMELSEKYPDE